MHKHPRPTRMQGRATGSELHKNGGSWTKQPRPLEDGNWVCEDPHCNNVNYPRRTQCHKCGKKRGPFGEAVVRAYIESLRIANGDYLHLAMAQGMFPHNGFQVHQQRQRTEWMKPPIAPIGPQYIPLPDIRSPFPPRRSFLSVATEGKHLAEHLVALFAASSDPLGDSGECLALAALWLRNMKCNLKQDKTATSPLMSTGSPTFKGIPLSVDHSTGLEGTPNMAVVQRCNCSFNQLGKIAIGPRGMRFPPPPAPAPGWDHFKDQPGNYTWDLNTQEVLTRHFTHQRITDENLNVFERKTCIQCNNNKDSEEENDENKDSEEEDNEMVEMVAKYVDSLLEDLEDR